MLGEHLGLIGRDLREALLQRLGDPGVVVRPARLEQRLVGDLLDQRVPELVARLPPLAARPDQVGADQLGEARGELVRAEARDGGEVIVLEPPTQDRREQRELARRLQVVEPGHQPVVVQGVAGPGRRATAPRGGRQHRSQARRPPAATASAPRCRAARRRCARGSGATPRRERAASDRLGEPRAAVLAIEAAEAQARDARLPGPGRPVGRAEGDHHY